MNKIKHNLFDKDKACTITQSFVTNVRGLNKDEEPMQDSVKMTLEALSLDIDIEKIRVTTDGNYEKKKRKGGKSSKKKGKGKKTVKAGLK